MIIAGLLIFALGVTDYDSSRMIMNHFSLDGSMKSYTADLYHAYRFPFMLLGVVISVAGILGLVFFNSTSHWMGNRLAKSQRTWKHLWSDARQLWFDVTHPGFAGWEWLILIVLVLLAFVGRWIWVERPMLHDESYTFIAFAQQPLGNVISDYHLPNNHVLNSILIHIFYSIFGNISPLIVRLPALLAGVLCVPLVYVWARKQYGIYPAIISAALVAYFPWMISLSTNGRGYMLVAMFTVLMLILANRVREKKDWASWALFVFATVLNFYTVPIALYPFGIISLWLLVSAIRGDIAATYGGFWHFFRYMVVYGVFSAALTLLLYSPIFLFGTGWNSFFKNPFVAPLDWSDFLQTMAARLGETLKEWQLGVPIWFLIFLAAGIVLSVVFHRQSKSGKTSLQICTVIALIVIFAVQRPNPWARIWVFIMPMLLVWAAAGWSLFTERVIRNEKYTRIVQKLMLSGLLIVIIVLSIINISKNLQYYKGEKGQEETVTLALKSVLKADDVVLTSASFGPAFWYYFDLHKMPMNTIINQDFEKGWQHAYFILDDRDNQNPLDLTSGTPLTDAECPLDNLQQIDENGHYRIYRCTRNN